MSMNMETKDHVQSKKLEGNNTTADLPPPYTRRDVQTVVNPVAGPSRVPGALESQVSHSSQAGIQSSNFILVSKERGPVKETFVIDPTIEVPAHSLPPLENNRMPKWLRRPSSLWTKEEEAARANLILKTKEGSIDAEVYVTVSPQYPTDKIPVRTAVTARSKQGNIVLNLHRDPSTRSAIYIHASSNKGTVVVNLPRSFQGPLKLSSNHGYITRSREITTASRFLFEKDHVQHIFVGDQTTWNANSAEWKGDEAVVQSRDANVKIRFDDEPDDWGRLVKGVKGFVSWLFGSQ